MKLLRSLTCLIITLQFAMAQFVNVQGVIRDNDSYSIPDGEYTITFKLYSTEGGGSSSWEEEQTLTVTNGVYGAALGTAEPLTSLDWETQLWLEIASINGASFSTSEALSPRTRLTMTPYALMAGMSGTTNVIPQDGDVQFGSSLNVDGNVGIGTTSPSFKLDVQPSSENARIGRAEVGGWPAHTDYAYFGNQDLNHGTAGNYALLQSSIGHTFLNASSGRNLNFRINNTDKMIIASNGNVGIGTISPEEKLHVIGKTRLQGDLGCEGDIYNNPFFLHPNCTDSNNNWRCISSHVFTSQSYYSSESDNVMSIGESGNTVQIRGDAMIGASRAPSEKLEVEGNIEFGSAAAGYKRFTADYDAWVRLYYGDGNNDYSHGLAVNNIWRMHAYSGSDSRLKENINDLEDGLDMLMQYRPVSYRLKSDEENKITYGFVAQDIQAIVSSEKTMVADGPDGYLGLSYTQFIPVLTKGMQELKTEKDEEINELIETIEALAQRIEELENK